MKLLIYFIFLLQRWKVVLEVKTVTLKRYYLNKIIIFHTYKSYKENFTPSIVAETYVKIVINNSTS